MSPERYYLGGFALGVLVTFGVAYLALPKIAKRSTAKALRANARDLGIELPASIVNRISEHVEMEVKRSVF